MKLLTATVTKPARSVSTKFGDRTVADVILPDGTEAALWRPANDSNLLALRAGQAVSVTKDSKGKVSLLDSPTAPTTPQPTPSQGIDPDTKRAIAAHVEERAKLFGFCVSQASTIQGLQAEDIRPVATTLYLDVVKKFGLN